MKPTKCSVLTMCLAAGMALALAAPSLAQNERKKEIQPTKAPAPTQAPAPGAVPAKVQPSGGQPAMDPAMAAMIAAGTPGENHALLAKFEGSWNGTVKMWMAPGETPTESPTTANQKMEMDGRYLYSHFKGDFMGQKFKGVGIMGYNNVLKKFQTTWIDNMGTGVETSAGSYDSATKTYNFSGEMTCPEKGGTVMSRCTLQWTGADSYVEKMYAPGPDGKEFLTMEISFKRSAGKSEGDKHEAKPKGKGN